MKRLLTLLTLSILTLALAQSQNGPCFDFDNEATTPVITNHTGSLVFNQLDNWSTRCSDLQYSNVGSQGGTSDVYLRGLDFGCGNAGSWMFNSIDYAGNWLTFGRCFCYDFRIFNNGNPTPAPPSNLYIYWGTDPFNRTYSARFVLNTAVSVADGWVTICPPIELADPVTGDLPSNAEGQWVMTMGTGAAAWDSLIQNVTGVGYNLDIGASPTEQYGFDNICFKNCPGEETPCDKLNLDAVFTWETGDSLWTVDLTDISTVDSAGTIAFIQWCVDTMVIPGFAGDQLTFDFEKPGTYDICLKIYGFTTDSTGTSICCKDTICETITLDICDYHEADIAVGPITGNTATLTDASTNGDISLWLADTTDATSLYITSGVGTSINHTYPGPGVYTARMISWWHYDGSLCCIDTVYTRVVIGQVTQSPCDTLKPWAVIGCEYVMDAGGNFGWRFTDSSAIGSSSHWYWNVGPGGISGSGDLITGGAGSMTPIQFFPSGQYRICMVSDYITSTGTICRDTVCKFVQVQAQPNTAICDTHEARFSYNRGRNYYASFTDISSDGDSSLWSFDGGATYTAFSGGTGSIVDNFFPSPGPHRICLISIWNPLPNVPGFECRDTVCRTISFPTVIQGDIAMRLAPNPVQDEASIQYAPQSAPVDLTIKNLQGNTIHSWTDDGDGNTSLNTEGMTSGMYLVSIRTKEGYTAVVKMMKK